MAAPEPTSVDEIWFFTTSHNLLIEEIDHLAQVGLTYSDPTRKRYVCLSGSARIIRDELKARELWNPQVGAWFPAGPSDPDLRLICVTAHRAEYWDTPTRRMALFFERAKIGPGGDAHPRAAEHRTIDLKP